METGIGINYEGGKIISHILRYDNCVAYANLQIAMDAPFHTPPRVADESVRREGRSELQFKGYHEEALKYRLRIVLEWVYRNYEDTKVVLQIARGRSAAATAKEVLLPVLDLCGIDYYELCFGYRSTDYYTPTDDVPFVFVNYGMFAVLQEPSQELSVGTICNPIETVNINNYNPDTGQWEIEVDRMRFRGEEKNILNDFDLTVPKITLLGLADELPFVTPDRYNSKHIRALCSMV